jgi:hypothetical protein
MALFTKRIVMCDVCGREIKEGSPMLVYQTGVFDGLTNYDAPRLISASGKVYNNKTYTHIRAVCLRRVHRKITESYLSKPVLSDITVVEEKVPTT